MKVLRSEGLKKKGNGREGKEGPRGRFARPIGGRRVVKVEKHCHRAKGGLSQRREEI